MKLEFKITKLLPVIIFVFYLCFFIYKIDQVPVSLFSDEADANYQAFIFNNKNTDYFGNKFPTHFHSFSDWRTSLYIYSVALTQKFIGHTDNAVRIPAAIYGALSVVAFYLISKKFFRDSLFWGLIGSFLYGFTPWLYLYSRSGFEVTQMLALLLFGIYFWVKFVYNKKKLNLFLSVGLFLSTIYSYSTAKLYIFMLAFLIFFIWFKIIIKIPLKIITILVLFSFILCLPFLNDLIKNRASYRFSYINIFSDPTVSHTVDYLRYNDSVIDHGSQIGLKPSITSKIFHNKLSLWSSTFIKNYFSSFSTDFLYLKGDGNLRQGIQTSGNLLLPSFFLIIIGISSIFIQKNHEKRKILLFFLFCLILAPIPFSLTRDSLFPHSTRLILMLPFLTIFSLIGFKIIIQMYNSKILILSILSLYLIFLSIFLHQYFYHYPNCSAREWHYGMKEVIVKSISNNYSKIYFINSYEPFLPFFLNYSKYLPSNPNLSPAENIIWDNNDFFTGMSTENKYYFGNIEWSIIFKNDIKQYLFVVPQKDMSRLESALNNHNQNTQTKIKSVLKYQTEKKYTEQEIIYLITFIQ